MLVQTSTALCWTKKAQQMVFNQGVKQHAMLHGTKKNVYKCTQHEKMSGLIQQMIENKKEIFLLLAHRVKDEALSIITQHY